jgi:hypothetical protein
LDARESEFCGGSIAIVGEIENQGLFRTHAGQLGNDVGVVNHGDRAAEGIIEPGIAVGQKIQGRCGGAEKVGTYGVGDILLVFCGAGGEIGNDLLPGFA